MANGRRSAKEGSGVSNQVPPIPEGDLLTLNQAAAYLQLSRKTITRWRDQRLVPYIQLPNGMTRFSRRELDAWIGSRSRTPRR